MSHLSLIASMPCILCEVLGMEQTSKTDCHHVREGQGMSQRAQDELAIPLCHDQCHQGPCGVHGDRSLLRIAKVDELDLLALTIRKLHGSFKAPPKTYRAPSKVLPRNWPPRAA